MWELDHKEGWMPKNCCFQTVVLYKTLESPLDSKEIKPVSAKGNQSWIFIGRTDFEAEAPILWPPDGKNWLIGKDSDAGKDSGQEKGATENEMVGLHHRLNGYEFEQTVRDSEGQGSLACCSPWGGTESDKTEWLNRNSNKVSPQLPLEEAQLYSLSLLEAFFLGHCLSCVSLPYSKLPKLIKIVPFSSSLPSNQIHVSYCHLFPTFVLMESLHVLGLPLWLSW